MQRVLATGKGQGGHWSQGWTGRAGWGAGNMPQAPLLSLSKDGRGRGLWGSGAAVGLHIPFLTPGGGRVFGKITLAAVGWTDGHQREMG